MLVPRVVVAMVMIMTHGHGHHRRRHGRGRGHGDGHRWVDVTTASTHRRVGQAFLFARTSTGVVASCGGDSLWGDTVKLSDPSIRVPDFTGTGLHFH